MTFTGSVCSPAPSVGPLLSVSKCLKSRKQPVKEEKVNRETKKKKRRRMLKDSPSVGSGAKSSGLAEVTVFDRELFTEAAADLCHMTSDC